MSDQITLSFLQESEVLLKGRRMEAQNIKGTIEEELYDVLYYILALANVYDVDLEQSFRLKEELNKLKYGHSLS